MVDLPLIGRGRTADVFDLGDGRVVKLLLPGFDPDVLEVEARKTRAAHEAGLAAPAAHGPLAIEGRIGRVFDRVHGTLMVDAVRNRPWRYATHARVLAETHAGLHAGSSRDLPSVKDRLADHIDRAPLEPSLRKAAKDRMTDLDDADRVLHGDFHPGNVVLGDGGPVVIDWLDASRGDPAADVARTAWLLSSPVIEPGAPHRRLLVLLVTAFRRTYLRAYRRRNPITPASLRAWRLPVLAGRMSEGIEHENEALVGEIRRLAGV